jgi:hypothetical protein
VAVVKGRMVIVGMLEDGRLDAERVMVVVVARSKEVVVARTEDMVVSCTAELVAKSEEVPEA